MFQLLVNDNGCLPESLTAPVADPLWAVYQQLAVGELRGESAGTLVRAEVTTETVPLPYGHDLPRRVTTEAESQLDPMTRATLLGEVGLRVLAWVRDRDGIVALPALRAAHPLEVPARDDAPRASLLARASLDPLHLRDALRDSGADPDLLAFVEGELEATLPEASSLWQPTTFRNEGTVDDGSGAIVHVRGLDDGPVGWWHLQVEPVPTALLSASTSITLPLPLAFAGMPSRRYWAMEDRQVHMGDVVSQSDALEPLIAAEFAMVYGDDWHFVPLRATTGHLLRIASVIVTDTFGVARTLPSATRRDVEVGRPAWSLWHLDGEAPPGDPSWATTAEGPWLALLPPQPGHDGPPVERVAFFPDQAANVAWAREEQVPRWVPGEAAPAPDDALPVDRQSELWTWTLVNRVPEGQFPLLPESRTVPDGEPPQIDLVLGSLAGATTTPAGQILDDLDAVRVPEESVRSPGVVVERRWHRARRPDGSSQVWTRRGRKVRSPGDWESVVFDAMRRSEAKDG